VSTKRLSGHFGRCGIEIPRQQFVDAVDGMVGDTRQHLAQIGFGIETVEFRRKQAGRAMDRRRKVELFEEIRREHAHGAGSRYDSGGS
jgi:hypothetical protein